MHAKLGEGVVTGVQPGGIVVVRFAGESARSQADGRLRADPQALTADSNPEVGLAASWAAGGDLASPRSDAQAPAPRLDRRPRRHVVLCGDHAAAARPDRRVRPVARPARASSPRPTRSARSSAASRAAAWRRASACARPCCSASALMMLASVAFAFAEHASSCSTSRASSRASAAPRRGRARWPGSPAAAPKEKRGQMIGTAMGAAIAGALLGPVIGVAADLLGYELVFCTVGGDRRRPDGLDAPHARGQAARRRLAARADRRAVATAASAPACCW